MTARAKLFFVKNCYKSNNIYIHRLATKTLHAKHNKKLGRLKYKNNKTNQFNTRVNAKIPALAWLCAVTEGEYNFCIGSDVEHSNTKIFEGVWDDCPDKSRIEKSEFVFGSGATIKKNEVIFIPPKHGLESLYVLYDKKLTKAYISNSICFIFSFAGIKTTSLGIYCY